MASLTPNFDLKKPAQTDFYDVDDFNDNMDIVDNELAKRPTKPNNFTAGNIAEFDSDGNIVDSNKNVGQIISSIETVEVINNLECTSTTAALSAAQGKVLKDSMADLSKVEVVDNLTSTSTTAALSAAQGKVLKGLIDGLPVSTDLVVTLTTSWSTTAPYSQTVAVTGMRPEMKPIIGVDLSDIVATALAQQEAWNMVGKAVTGLNSVTFKCYEEKPTVAIPVQVKLVR